jgi:HPt (histidine-containing phosphotransfer) domain-containing protein
LLALAALDAMFDVTVGVDASVSHAPLRERGAYFDMHDDAARRAAGLAARLRAAFVTDLPRRRAELDAALAADDADTVGRILHGLRGSASHLDQAPLEALCAELEAAASGFDLARVRAGLPQLQALLDAFPAHSG